MSSLRLLFNFRINLKFHHTPVPHIQYSKQQYVAKTLGSGSECIVSTSASSGKLESLQWITTPSGDIEYMKVSALYMSSFIEQ